jgi:hypothetical protein
MTLQAAGGLKDPAVGRRISDAQSIGTGFLKCENIFIKNIRNKNIVYDIMSKIKVLWQLR